MAAQKEGDRQVAGKPELVKRLDGFSAGDSDSGLKSIAALVRRTADANAAIAFLNSVVPGGYKIEQPPDIEEVVLDKWTFGLYLPEMKKVLLNRLGHFYGTLPHELYHHWQNLSGFTKKVNAFHYGGAGEKALPFLRATIKEAGANLFEAAFIEKEVFGSDEGRSIPASSLYPDSLEIGVGYSNILEAVHRDIRKKDFGRLGVDVCLQSSFEDLNPNMVVRLVAVSEALSVLASKDYSIKGALAVLGSSPQAIMSEVGNLGSIKLDELVSLIWPKPERKPEFEMRSRLMGRYM
jgi:hypothetical protein